jgi:hypothetical protein
MPRLFHAGCQVSATTMSVSDERQHLVPRSLATGGRDSSFEERSRRVPLIVGVTHVIGFRHDLHFYRR